MPPSKKIGGEENMLHESNNERITIEDSTIGFETVYKEDYFPQDLYDEVSKANMLIIPDSFSREDTSKYVFPETTKEFLGYAQDMKNDNFIPDIAADEESFDKLELHSAVITVATFIVTEVAFPVALNIVASFLYDQMKKHHRKGDELSAKLNIIVDDGKKSKKISYEGPAGSAEEALKLAVKGAFDMDGDSNEHSGD